VGGVSDADLRPSNDNGSKKSGEFIARRAANSTLTRRIANAYASTFAAGRHSPENRFSTDFELRKLTERNGFYVLLIRCRPIELAI
jgi:hypothetical protein